MFPQNHFSKLFYCCLIDVLIDCQNRVNLKLLYLFSFKKDLSFFSFNFTELNKDCFIVLKEISFLSLNFLFFYFFFFLDFIFIIKKNNFFMKKKILLKIFLYYFFNYVIVKFFIKEEKKKEFNIFRKLYLNIHKYIN
jgi:hypothetical protein